MENEIKIIKKSRHPIFLVSNSIEENTTKVAEIDIFIAILAKGGRQHSGRSLLHVFASNLTLNGRFCDDNQLQIQNCWRRHQRRASSQSKKHPALKLNINGKVQLL
jgi:hypothetical protein